ncbi:TonB-dependent hemoglobin/transferrin/lactoferrin family receptor [Campylobacter sp. CCUG 57310]|uniref:TonB-dependent hemoglobin/transferrin/lactoferrin family receptor n=1 Tax=Campylobacter sp. CCUG 57310 TaxID=2517362 RepID=UPI0015671583|nr:TonB-dependent hemoglobin/transferrin/lactoferrin family receptor [Campylobacter sp. CCUG 57310]QKF91921.1 TonB-dependent hemoglobin/transferrin/lactoferrin receptor family protein [Campylobacter sp. CCUG 57310]
MGKLKFSLVALAILGMGLNLQGEDKNVDQVELGGVTITDSPEEDPLQKKVGEIKKSDKTLSKQQISDTKDLVKYETGVSVVETGRFGASGYAIRGVDENRVAITIDGLHQAETLSSQGFKEIFEGYGNFNNTRNGVEIETVKEVSIAKGANSVKTGSGALGGSVMFETKDARDFLLKKDYFYGYKGGVSTADDQRLHSHTLAARYKWFDILFITTKRRHHETKNYGYDSYDDSIVGREREKADPYYIKKHSNLIKVGFQPHEEHRFGFAIDDYENISKGHDYSYTLSPKSITGFDFPQKLGQRHTTDTTTRKNFSMTYENFTETPLWDSVKFTYSNQKIKTRARTEEFCRGSDCAEIANPIGLNVQNGKVVDKHGKDVTLTKDGAGGLSVLTDSTGKRHSSGFNLKNVNEYLFDCSVYDCSKDITLYENPPYGDPNIKGHNIDLSKGVTEITGKDGKKYKFSVTEEKQGGKIYKKIKATHKFINGFGKEVEANTNKFSTLTPGSKGYLERDWKERDLNTDTKQFNLDFTKEFTIFSMDHSLSYGGLYARGKKEMVNRQGYDATAPAWWTDDFKDCKGTGFNGLKCPKVEPETSFLIPVKNENGAFYVADEVQINDYVGIDLGYRYDKIKYTPEYIPGVSPKVPDDMVKGLFIPLKPVPPIKPAPSILEKPFPWEPKYRGKPDLYQKDLKAYNDKVAEHEKSKAEAAKVEQENKLNPQKNIEYFSRPREFKSSSYSLGFTLDPLDFIRIQTKYSKGFRAPTHEELYLAFKHPDFTIKPNVNLQPEIAKTKEIALTFHQNSSFISFSTFKTDYANFLDLKFLGVERKNAGNNVNSGLDFDIYQNVNRQKAKVGGIEINSKLNLGDVFEPFKGFHVGYKLTKQKGKILTDEDGLVPMNAIQPRTSVYNIGYASKNDKFGADLYITDVSAKKPQDTYNMFWRNEKPGNPPSARDYINGRLVTDYRSHWLSTKYTTIDIIAYTKPIKNLTLRLGAYNLTDEKYITWESARSIRSFGTTNMVRKSDGLGINRFNAPGRNFKFTFEFTF